ncbi:hypothetical protein CBS101457_004226 [Exobasidium rhododendri]|nr:hypothetical protein CBS101457_004226 [Exobasidium rhododendri]
MTSSTAASSSAKQVFHSPSLPLHFPKDTVDLTLIQLGQTSFDKKKNIEHASRTISTAVKPTPRGEENVQMVVLPECWNSPYGVQYFDKYAEEFGGLWEKVKPSLSSERCKVIDTFDPAQESRLAEDQQQAFEHRWAVDGVASSRVDIDSSCPSETIQMMSNIAKKLGVVLVGGSIPERDASSGKLYNTSTVFNEEGQLISMHRKLHLFDIDIPGGMTFQESKTLTAGNRVTVFECSLGRFGLGICYDLRFPEPATLACRLGAGVMLYPGAFNTTTGPRSWELLLRSRATDNQLYTIGCSPARPTKEDIEGPTKAYPTYGYTLLADPWGQVKESLDEREGILRVQLKKDEIVTARSNVPISRQRRFDVYPDVALG